MKPILDYFPVELCRTWHCGNYADKDTGFCHECMPPAYQDSLFFRVLLYPFRLLAVLMGV